MTGPTGTFQPLGTNWGDTINWNNLTSSWQITSNPIALGQFSGQFSQGTASVALGQNAGQYSQGSGSVAIGYHAGQTGQGLNSVAVGAFAGYSGQAPNSIVLNASGNNFTAGTTGFFVNPVRIVATSGLTAFNPMYFNVFTNEIVSSSNDSVYGGFYLPNTTTFSINVAGGGTTYTPLYPAAGTFTASNLQNMAYTPPVVGVSGPSLTTTISGVYSVVISMSFSRGNSGTQQLDMAVFLNGVITPNIFQNITLSASNTYYSMSANGLLTLSGTSLIDARVLLSANNASITFYEFNLIILCRTAPRRC